MEDLRKELQAVIDWLRQNKLSLNVTKCEYMLLGSNKQLGKISEIGDLKVGEEEIKRVRKTKYLGLTIDETMSWNQQYKIVKGKVKGGLDSIRKLRQGIGGKSPQIWQYNMGSPFRNQTQQITKVIRQGNRIDPICTYEGQNAVCNIKCT